MNYQKATFLLSVANLHQLPPDAGVEIAIIGRSNAGKSSVLNQLTKNNSLARVSKTPGRTQHINLFGLDEKHRIADLPGYGYAKVPPNMKKHWQTLINTYLYERQCLHGLILVMDIRHPLKDFDLQMLEWANASELAVHILLNKSDKLTPNQQRKTLSLVSEAISEYGTPFSVQLFSAVKGQGLDELKSALAPWWKKSAS